MDSADIDLRIAIYYAENGLAFDRDFTSESSQRRATARMDRLFRSARIERPLIWQAFEARCARRPVCSTDAPRRILTWEQVGGQTPALPRFPEPQREPLGGS